VTGVQTCALPICRTEAVRTAVKALVGPTEVSAPASVGAVPDAVAPTPHPGVAMFGDGDMVCTRCSKGRLYRSRVKSLIERARKEFTAKRPFRCDTCGWRGWLPIIEPAVPLTVDAVATPELSMLDRAVATGPDAHRPFSPRDLA